MRLAEFIIVLLALFVGSAIAEELTIPEDKTVIKFPSKLGDVTFPHQMHSSLSITECKTCHHKLEPTDTVVKPCHECHQHKGASIKQAKPDEPPKTKDVFHVRCIGCHEYTVAGGDHAGPVKKKCKLCHVKEKK